MIDPLIRAMQAAQSGPPLRLLRVTVTAVNPLRVALPGGATVAGAAVAGLTYAVGQQAYALFQEPAVGPVFPTT